MFGGTKTQDESAEQVSDEEIICVDYLDRQADIFCRIAFKTNLTVMSLAKAKLQLQSSTQHTLEDIELLLKHLEHSGRVLVQKIGGDDANDENTILKFLQPSERNQEASIITQKEIALYSLQQNITKLEGKAQAISERIRQEDIKIVQLLQQKNKKGAAYALQRKKMYESECNKQHNMINELEKQRLTLEAADDTSAVFETLSLATATSKEAI